MRIKGATMKRALGLTVAIAAISAATLPAHAFLNGSSYSYGSYDSCTAATKVADPIGAVFYGSAARWDVVGSRSDHKGDVERHTGWSTHAGEAPQWYRDADNCWVPSGQLASRSGPFHSRFHIRMWEKIGLDQKARHEVVATPHHEDWIYSTQHIGCNKFGVGNHAIDHGAVDRGAGDRTQNGSGFDWGRRELASHYTGSRHHDVTYTYEGNTRSVKQCDGEYAGSNGNVVWISMGRH
jgi:hypothetical protein